MRLHEITQQNKMWASIANIDFNIITDADNMIKIATILLTAGRSRQQVLGPIVSAFLETLVAASQVHFPDNLDPDILEFTQSLTIRINTLTELINKMK